ncbi:Uncharacterized protein TCM_017724 [Theobroma cacao]|uniref:Uncharacterized protein n=1 Tax=Theobroma cacao TaxID=3641 RepID=A0A061EFN2_THECC|nr:Uncharacterized protein TCM_017724 [Theobroma cacao]
MSLFYVWGRPSGKQDEMKKKERSYCKRENGSKNKEERSRCEREREQRGKLPAKGEREGWKRVENKWQLPPLKGVKREALCCKILRAKKREFCCKF